MLNAMVLRPSFATLRSTVTIMSLGVLCLLLIAVSTAQSPSNILHLVGGISAGCGFAIGLGTGLGIGALWTAPALPISGVLGTASLLILGGAAIYCS